MCGLAAGDGEPDEDFPALDRKRILKQFGNVSEYCLCRKGSVAVPPVPAAADKKNSASANAEDSLPVRVWLSSTTGVKPTTCMPLNELINARVCVCVCVRPT